MGSVVETDCSVAATNNQIPDGGNYNFDIPVPSTVTVNLNDVDGVLMVPLMMNLLSYY